MLPKEEDVATKPVVTPDDAIMDGKIGEEVEVGGPAEPEAGDKLDIEVIDERPPEDRREPIKDQSTIGADEEIDAELDKLNKQGAKRIQQLKHQVHDQRRLKEAAEREREAAVRYAAQMRERYVQVQKRAAEVERIAYEQALVRARAELEAAKRDHRSAYETGDADKIAEATTRMARAAQDEQRYSNIQVPDPEPVPEFQDPRQQIPDQRAMEWMRKNPWFSMAGGRPANPESATAYSIHVALVQEGIDPRAPDGRYYQELDRRLRAVYPDKFAKEEDDESEPSAKPARPSSAGKQVVAPAQRGAPGPKKVTLTQSEVDLAKKLGVPLDEFARQKILLPS